MIIEPNEFLAAGIKPVIRELSKYMLENAPDEYEESDFDVPEGAPRILIVHADGDNERNNPLGHRAIYSKEFMSKAKEHIDGGFYIIPSSVYEVLLIAEERNPRTDAELFTMIREVNNNDRLLKPEDRLSYYPMYCDGKAITVI